MSRTRPCAALPRLPLTRLPRCREPATPPTTLLFKVVQAQTQAQAQAQTMVAVKAARVGTTPRTVTVSVTMSLAVAVTPAVAVAVTMMKRITMIPITLCVFVAAVDVVQGRKRSRKGSTPQPRRGKIDKSTSPAFPSIAAVQLHAATAPVGDVAATAAAAVPAAAAVAVAAVPAAVAVATCLVVPHNAAVHAAGVNALFHTTATVTVTVTATAAATRTAPSDVAAPLQRIVTLWTLRRCLPTSSCFCEAACVRPGLGVPPRCCRLIMVMFIVYGNRGGGGGCSFRLFRDGSSPGPGPQVLFVCLLSLFRFVGCCVFSFLLVMSLAVFLSVPCRRDRKCGVAGGAAAAAAV